MMCALKRAFSERDFVNPYGCTAADSARQLIKGQPVLVKYQYSDVYKRPVCEIIFTAKNPGQTTDTLDLAQYIVSKGWASYRTGQKNARANSLMKKIQAYAKEQKIGLWGEKGRAVRPETFRKRFRKK
ncbi:MAG: thermonuclease family protein [Saprospiraceae bacterium]|nr:thermonuclease family protein [Saprospiraceae bacterium]